MSTLSDIYSTLAKGDSISGNVLTTDYGYRSFSKPLPTRGGGVIFESRISQRILGFAHSTIDSVGVDTLAVAVVSDVNGYLQVLGSWVKSFSTSAYFDATVWRMGAPWVHIILDTSTSKFLVYDAINKKLLIDITLNVPDNVQNIYLFSNACYNTGSTTSSNTINPDTPSFKYKPFVPHEIDLYSKILGLPYSWSGNTTKNNVLSIV